MNKFFSFLISTIIVVTTNAQSGKINGSIKDGGKQQIIDAATISLLNAKDSVLLRSAITDKEGKFIFENLIGGSYLIVATSIGHNKAYSDELKITPEKLEIDAGILQLTPLEKSMAAVVVTATKPFIERKLDKTIVNVDASISNVGATAIEVLEKSPGITVDKDGNISLKGKPGVKIFIDGKPSYLSGTDLANMLKSMSASQLEQIEIMTNPSAKYDAAGNSGVINIKTKKSKTVGFNGAITSTYNQGRYSRFNEGLNFNYRNKNVNLFGNYSNRNGKNFSELEIFRKFRDKDSKEVLSIFDQKARFNTTNESNNAKLGMDITLNKKTSIGGVVSGYLNEEKFNNFNNTYLKDKNEIIDSRTFATIDMTNKWDNISGNINLRHVFDSTGKELTADLDYINYGSKNMQTLGNHYYNIYNDKISPSDTLKGNILSNITIYSAKADYTQNLKKNIKLETGVKVSFVKTDNNVRYDSLINEKLLPDTGRSNHFIYDEQIQAAYANINKQFNKKWSTQIGLRVENTIARGNQITKNKQFERKYTQLFPTVYVSYDANEKNNMAINYGRRIDRPDYEDLNPFYFFVDKYTYQVGNPNLRPQFSHNVELSHTYNGKITTTLNYTKNTDLINEIFDQNETTKETYITKGNIASSRQIGVAVSAFVPVQKWLKLNLYANVANNRFKGFINNADVDVKGTMLETNASAQMNLGKGWSAELSGFYRSKGLDGVMVMNGLGALNAGISKSILKKKGTIKLNFRDIFWTQQFTGTAQYSYIDMRFRQRRDSRQVGVSFNYSFGKGKITASKRKVGSASEEQNRVKNGGN